MSAIPFRNQTLQLERVYLRDGPDTASLFPRGLRASDDADESGRVWTAEGDAPVTLTVRRDGARIRGEPGKDPDQWPLSVRRALDDLVDHSRDGMALLLGAAPLSLDDFDLRDGPAENADKFGWVLLAELSDDDCRGGDPFRLDLTLARPGRAADPGSGGSVRRLGHGNVPR